MQTSYRQLLVHFDPSAKSKRRLEYAQKIAQPFEAAVTALYAVAPSYVDYPYAPIAGLDMAASIRDLEEQQRAECQALFAQSQVSVAQPARWAYIDVAPMETAFAQQAFYADLMVLGQSNDRRAQNFKVPDDFVETVLSISGKPALILPHSVVPDTLAETIAIAWKPARETAKAVAAAMPLLQRARNVHVLQWGSREESINGARLDLEGYLKLHGVQAIWHQQGIEPNYLGELLLSRTYELNADLLVMGCYGHSRAREWILGGASRTVLQGMTLPVLMAH